MTNLNNLAAELNDRPEVDFAKVWKDRRIYVTLVGVNKSFAGDRNLNIYFDAKAGWIDEGHKGTKSPALQDSYKSFYDGVINA